MTVGFHEHFWGDRHRGFEALMNNLKVGNSAAKDLMEFFRERSTIEETYSKLLLKLSKQANIGCSSSGSFAPLWQVLKCSSEKLSTLHAQMTHRFKELMQEVKDYYEEDGKKHKKIREEESGTEEVVKSFQQTESTLQKAKELYSARYLEYEKLKRDSASAKEIEKAEIKYRKSCEEYKSLIEKYSNIRNNFEQKMVISCQHFQKNEEDHLIQMKKFLTTYAQVLENGHTLIGQLSDNEKMRNKFFWEHVVVYLELRQQCANMDVEDLLEIFLRTRGTGTEKPGPVYFEEADVSKNLPPVLPVPNDLPNGAPKKEDVFPGHGYMSSPDGKNGPTPPLARTTFRASKWFLKSKREKRKEKKRKKGNKEEISGTVDTTATVGDGDKKPIEDCMLKQDTAFDIAVDDQGFTVPPSHSKENDKDSFYSSSDGESEEEEKERKIHIHIKPLSNGSPMSASVDELRATVGALTLSPVSLHTRRPDALHIRFKQNRRTFSSATSTPEDGPIKAKTDGDILSLLSPSTSSASTPTGGLNMTSSEGNLDTTSFGNQPEISTGGSSERYAGLSEIFAEISQAESSSAEVAKLTSNNNLSLSGGVGAGGGNSGNGGGSGVSTPTICPPVLPRPPSRRPIEQLPPRGRMSPLPGSMTRTESVGSLTSDFKTTSMSVGSSRGPSPLTIGMCDPIPLAVAFQEVVHAYFRGHDESRCQVRLLGDMKISFPAGIVQVLANNPSPATLTFRVTRTGKMENLLPNKQLITQDMTASTSDHAVFEFNMVALTSLLRKQFEMSPNASYFNIDILKYHIKQQPGAKSTPLHLVSYWKCTESTTDLKIDYKYNPVAMATMAPITNISIIVPVDGGVSNVQSMPTVQWNNETSRATWWITELSHHSDGGGMGSLRARFDLTSGPSIPSTLAVQFTCLGTSVSGADFELVGLGYRLSLVKKQVIAGKYLCEGDTSSSYA